MVVNYTVARHFCQLRHPGTTSGMLCKSSAPVWKLAGVAIVSSIRIAPALAAIRADANRVLFLGCISCASGERRSNSWQWHVGVFPELWGGVMLSYSLGYGGLFVHHLHRTVFRISPRLYYLPQSRPWPGDFDARNRLGLLSHTAALAGGRSIREQLLLASARRYYGITEALTWLCSSDRSSLRQLVEAWPQIQRNTVFQRTEIIKEKFLY
jgi:hypothetical protein